MGLSYFAYSYFNYSISPTQEYLCHPPTQHVTAGNTYQKLTLDNITILLQISVWRIHLK